MEIMVLAIVGYLIGSIPFGYIAGIMHGVDLRTVGSGSTGGTNVYRALGIRWAALSGTLDLAKGLVFVFLLDTLTPTQTTLQWFLLLAPIVGHIYPVWLNFKGGKGVSVAFGGLMYVLGVPFAVVSIAIWIVALKIIKIMSLVNLVLFALLPVYVYATTQSLAYTIASAFVALIIWWAHRENIARLRTGNEKKLAI